MHGASTWSGRSDCDHHISICYCSHAVRPARSTGRRLSEAPPPRPDHLTNTRLKSTVIYQAVVPIESGLKRVTGSKSAANLSLHLCRKAEVHWDLQELCFMWDAVLAVQNNGPKFKLCMLQSSQWWEHGALMKDIRNLQRWEYNKTKNWRAASKYLYLIQFHW